MYTELPKVTQDVIDRLRFTELLSPVMFNCTEETCEMYSVPVFHRSNRRGDEAPMIHNWVLVIREDDTQLWTHCGSISGSVLKEYRSSIINVFRKLEHQGMLNFMDINMIALSFGVHDIMDIRRIANMAINAGVYFGEYMRSVSWNTTPIKAEGCTAKKCFKEEVSMSKGCGQPCRKRPGKRRRDAAKAAARRTQEGVSNTLL